MCAYFSVIHFCLNFKFLFPLPGKILLFVTEVFNMNKNFRQVAIGAWKGFKKTITLHNKQVMWERFLTKSKEYTWVRKVVHTKLLNWRNLYQRDKHKAVWSKNIAIICSKWGKHGHTKLSDKNLRNCQILFKNEEKGDCSKLRNWCIFVCKWCTVGTRLVHCFILFWNY